MTHSNPRARFDITSIFGRKLLRAFIPRFERCAAEVHAVQQKLQGLGLEFDAALAGLAGTGPAEAAFFEPFCRDPCAGSIEVEELDAVAVLVSEHEKRVASGNGVVVAVGKFGQAVEGLAHVTGFKGEEDLESGAAEVQHERPPFLSR